MPCWDFLRLETRDNYSFQAFDVAFFPRVWPMSRKRLGPYMRITWKYIVQGQKVLGVGKSIEATERQCRVTTEVVRQV